MTARFATTINHLLIIQSIILNKFIDYFGLPHKMKIYRIQFSDLA